MVRRRPSRPATIADLDALEGDMHGELIDGVIYEPTPRCFEHGHVRMNMLMQLVSPYEDGAKGKPGEWWVQGPNDFTVAGREVFRPDLLGWRKAKLPSPSRTERVDVVPDWVCEIVSKDSRAYDLKTKRSAYARVGVRYRWYVDLETHVLSVFELAADGWRELGVYCDDDSVRAPPFDGAKVEMSEW
jgi:Uma2 family endonuclease